MGLFDDDVIHGDDRTSTKTVLDNDFEIFWAQYPRRTGKLAARREYAKARKTVSAAIILDGIARYQQSKPEHIDFCHPRTFLSQGRWMDDPQQEHQDHATNDDRDDVLVTFDIVMKRLGRAMRLHVDTTEFAGQLATYRRLLHEVPLADLSAGADVWASTQTKFPKPAEWRAAVPRRALIVRTMTDAEAREYRDAAIHNWERPSCHCVICLAAGADGYPQRYVPDCDMHGETVPVREPFSQHLVVAGRWIHGDDLLRWWQACGLFWERAGGLRVLGSIASLRRCQPDQIAVALARTKEMP